MAAVANEDLINEDIEACHVEALASYHYTRVAAHEIAVLHEYVCDVRLLLARSEVPDSNPDVQSADLVCGVDWYVPSGYVAYCDVLNVDPSLYFIVT
jgi:hypothetical protein